MVAFEVQEILGKNRMEPDYGSTIQYAIIALKLFQDLFDLTGTL